MTLTNLDISREAAAATGARSLLASARTTYGVAPILRSLPTLITTLTHQISPEKSETISQWNPERVHKESFRALWAPHLRQLARRPGINEIDARLCHHLSLAPCCDVLVDICQQVNLPAHPSSHPPLVSSLGVHHFVEVLLSRHKRGVTCQAHPRFSSCWFRLSTSARQPALMSSMTRLASTSVRPCLQVDKLPLPNFDSVTMSNLCCQRPTTPAQHRRTFREHAIQKTIESHIGHMVMGEP